ncbi:MAG: flagellar filament capping protein FliD [Geminicoccaceae bacterium]|nr:flagellar filament capping protein FliD [Geminicoccaceae bacterium]MCX8100669.1 flagellar filament capping protein FliD [Geminicoccaceae bacterium]MDW8371802.1 flagellar filament capping protein FliD [Geminicoccaceae bacterium]
MVESLGFGNLSLAGGTPRLTGTSSKLDTEALARAAYEAKRAPAVRLEARIGKNEAKLAALDELKGLLQELRSAANGLRNPPGILGRSENLFESKRVFLAGSGSVAATSILGATADASAAVGSVELVVERTATAHKLQAQAASASGQSLADAWNGGAGFSGRLEVGLAGGEKVEIAVSGTTTLAGLADAINARAARSGVGANLVRVGPGEVRLVLSARETGRAIELADVGDDPVLPLMQTSELVAAQTARVRIDGIVVERAGNRIDDALRGVVLDLYKAEPSTTVTLAVEPDIQAVKEQVGRFVEAYNALRDFLAKHSRVDGEGKVAADAVLFGDRTLRTIARTLAQEIGSGALGLAPGAASTLRAIGITIGEGGRLGLEEAKLDRALLTNLDQVRSLFEFRATTSSPELAVMARSNSLAQTSFAVEITDADADGTPEAARIGGVAAEIRGRRIVGPAGSGFDGLELAWIGSGSTTITVTASQGVADRVFNALEEALRPGAGSLARASEELGGVNRAWREQIALIEERAQRARNELVEKLTRMESALGLANTMLAQLRAQTDAWTAGR